MNLFSGIIHSGNTYEHVRDAFKYLYHQDNIVEIFSDFGNVHFTSDDFKFSLLSDEFVVDKSIITGLEKVPEFKGKTKMRTSGCVVTIKPLVNREVLLRKAEKVLEEYGDKYEARISGHTSIDIMVKTFDKKKMLQMIMDRQGLKVNDVIFVGNETEDGAEANIKETGVRTLQVDDVYECNVLLRTINA